MVGFVSAQLTVAVLAHTLMAVVEAQGVWCKNSRVGTKAAAMTRYRRSALYENSGSLWNIERARCFRKTADRHRSAA